MKFETLAIHAGQAADAATGATIVPVYQTVTFTQDAIGHDRGFVYSRSGNPTRQALETCLAALDRARDAARPGGRPRRRRRRSLRRHAPALLEDPAGLRRALHLRGRDARRRG